MKTHIVKSKEPIQQWPDQIMTLCGEIVKQPQPVLSLGPDGRFEGGSTIYFCEDCGTVALVTAAETAGPNYFYGVLPAEQAHRMNLAERAID